MLSYGSGDKYVVILGFSSVAEWRHASGLDAQYGLGSVLAPVAAARIAGRPGAHRFANFIIWNGPCRRESAIQSVRLLLFRAFGR